MSSRKLRLNQTTGRRALPVVPHAALERVWRHFACHGLDHLESDSTSPRFQCWDTFSVLKQGSEASGEQDDDHLACLAARLLENAAHVEQHVSLLNHSIATLVLCSYDRRNHQCVTKAEDMLSRLPPIPPELPLREIFGSHECVGHGASFCEHDLSGYLDSQEASWDHIKVVSIIDGCTMRLALAIADSPADSSDSSLSHGIVAYLDQIAQLIDIICDKPKNRDGCSVSRAICASFLWAVWHRSVTLLLVHSLNCEIHLGQDMYNKNILALRYPGLLSNSTVCDSFRGSKGRSSPYLCPWAFELLQATRVAPALDFRLFQRRFSEAFPAASPRCTVTSEQCMGTSPEACGRFTSTDLAIPEQAVHDGQCSACERMIWDEASYRKISGGRAVDISSRSSAIKYRKADRATLAISHVWSHGQGGRPDTGINRCLHRRYVQIAKKYGCKSYWIDTVCIPDREDLRREAISYINETFTQSRITLICDRDIYSLSAPAGKEDTVQMERLFCTLLICDWNVRGWTLLESVRGRYNTHLLCANNELVSVRDLVKGILAAGALDIGVLGLAAQHVIGPMSDISDRQVILFGTAQASSLLSHRRATREGDDIVIWTLLCCKGKDVFKDPTLFWQSKVGTSLESGYLMSNLPRLSGSKGFSWAPQTPNVRPSQYVDTHSVMGLYADVGSGSEECRITQHGLDGFWMFHDLGSLDEEAHAEKGLNYKPSGSSLTPAMDPSTYNPCWNHIQKLQRTHRRLGLITPKLPGLGRYIGAEEARSQNYMVAVIILERVAKVTEHFEDVWTWEGLYEWNRHIPLPPMEPRRILLT